MERGFSVNKECLFENMEENSIIGRRQIYDYISSAGGLENYEISKSLILSCRNANSLWKDDLKNKKELKSKENKTLEESKIRSLKIKKTQGNLFSQICRHPENPCDLSIWQTLLCLKFQASCLKITAKNIAA